MVFVRTSDLRRETFACLWYARLRGRKISMGHAQRSMSKNIGSHPGGIRIEFLDIGLMFRDMIEHEHKGTCGSSQNVDDQRQGQKV